MKKIVFLIIIGIMPTLLFAQGAQTGTTPEERFLSRSDTEIRIIAALAAADTREQKMVALDSIEAMVKEGTVNQNDTEIINIIRDLAGEGTYVVVREGGWRANNFPDVRSRSVKLFGELGGESSKDMLLYISEREVEPMVLSELVFALGVIGLNDNNEALLAITRILHDNNKRIPFPDNNLAIAGLLAIEKIVEKNNGFPNEPNPRFLYGAIMEIMTGSYNLNVRVWAENLMLRLRKY